MIALLGASICYTRFMNLHLVSSSERARYDAFVADHGGSVVQSWGFGAFRAEQNGGRFRAFAVERNGVWLGSVLVVRYGLPFRLCWLSMARGPVLADGVDAKAVWRLLREGIGRFAQEERAVFVRGELPEDSPIKLVMGEGWRTAHSHHHPEWTLMVDVTGSEEEILKQMKPKGRYNIKVAEKNGVTIRATHHPRDVAAFYRILAETGGRDGFGIHPEPYYLGLVEAGTKEGWGTLYVAEAGGAIVSGIFVTFYGGVATYYYGASAHHYRALMAPYLLQWTAIMEAKNRGALRYDFLGVSPPNEPNHAWKGITEFKEKFGGVRVKYPEAKEWVLRPLWYRLMVGLKRLKVR